MMVAKTWPKLLGMCFVSDHGSKRAEYLVMKVYQNFNLLEDAEIQNALGIMTLYCCEIEMFTFSELKQRIDSSLIQTLVQGVRKW